MKKNDGFTLVELLVAIAIAAVVAGSVSFLLFTSMRMFNKETVEVDLQQELQLSINQMMDYAMESETIIADFDGNYPDYIAFGNYTDSTLSAHIIWRDGNRLYLKNDDIPDFVNTDLNDETNYGKIVASEITDRIPATEGSSPTANLMADYVKAFDVEVGGLENVYAEGSTAIVGYEFKNPLSVDITLEFEKAVRTANTKGKRVNEKVSLRNRVKYNIFVNTHEYSLKKQISKAEPLTITTETVKLDNKLGYLKIDGDETHSRPGDLNILEIVPDYSYDYVQFAIAGKDGKMLNTVNTDYGSSAPFGPVTAAEMEGYVNMAAGSYHQSIYYEAPVVSVHSDTGTLFMNSGASVPAYYVSSSYENMTGYYEYVGEANGGIYALSSYELAESLAPVAGSGNARPNIKCFSLEGLSNISNTTKRYNPVFEFVAKDDKSNDFYTPQINYDSNARKDYKRVYRNNDSNQGLLRYEYVGGGRGDIALKFNRYNINQGYSPNNGTGFEYKVKGNIYAYSDNENGQYCASYDGFTTREDITYSEAGYDYNMSVSLVVMCSKFYESQPTYDKDYGWIWHEVQNGSGVYNSIQDGSLCTSSSVVESKAWKNSGTSDNKRIYLKNHKRYRIVNNDTFKLLIMQDVLEGYTTAKKLNIKKGIWDPSTNWYDEVNSKAVKDWEADNHRIKLSVRTPEDIADSDIEAADLIIIGGPNDGGFKNANLLSNALRNRTGTASYGLSNDISFEHVIKIYKKVISEEAAIAAPSELGGLGSGETNLSKLFIMLFCVKNDNVTKSSVSDETYLNAKDEKIEKQGSSNYWTEDATYQSEIEGKITTLGSGRMMFSDFILSMEDKAMSKSMYGTTPMSMKTSDFVYLDEDRNSSDYGKLVVNTCNDLNVDGYTLNVSGYTNNNWGGTGSGNFEVNFLQNEAGNRNEYISHRYSSGVIFNNELNMYYKFSYGQQTEGLYKNQLVYNNDSTLMTYNSSGSTGTLMLQNVNNSATRKNGGSVTDVIGTMEYVGADDIESGTYRRNNQGDTTTYKFEDHPIEYSKRVIRLEGGIDKKVIYLSEAEYEKAKIEGLYLYCLVKTSKDNNMYNKCVTTYKRNDGSSWRFDYDDDIYGGDAYTHPDNNTSSTNCRRYAAGGGVSDAYVYEYRYKVDPLYFQNITPMNNVVPSTHIPNNAFVAKVDAGNGKLYQGSDELFFVIRDTFDLE